MKARGAKRAKFKVGQVVAVFGVPELKEADKFLGYHRISAKREGGGKFFYDFDGQSIREIRLRGLTAKERGHAK